MFRYSILQPPECLLDESIIDTIFNSVYKSISLPQNGVINIVCVSPEEIKALNKQYRKKDSITDVLSFHYFEDFSEVTKDEIAGEIILCEARVIE
jgi:ssRNA-specific RNase YbeY (16S rRNA maturation enzyme)